MIYSELPDITLLGDVHLGRRFIEGVPIHRRGEREEMVWAQFETELKACATSLHVQVGDLFDGFDVSNEVVLRAANVYLAASSAKPDCLFVVETGNHDWSKDSSKVSSFELFKAIVEKASNIKVVTQPMRFGRVGVIPWSPFDSAEAQALKLSTLGSDFDCVVAHCDTKAWNGNDFNVLPLAQLKELTSVVVTGHEHIKRSFKSQGVTVHVTGSMQPYSHGEDPDQTMYWTGTADELALIDPTNLYIRVQLLPGEEPPPIPNCLGFKTIAADASDDEEADIEVAFEDFDTTAIFKQILQEQGVVEQIRDLVLGRFKESLNG